MTGELTQDSDRVLVGFVPQKSDHTDLNIYTIRSMTRPFLLLHLILLLSIFICCSLHAGTFLIYLEGPKVIQVDTSEEIMDEGKVTTKLLYDTPLTQQRGKHRGLTFCSRRNMLFQYIELK